jgi:hypothetical protein
MAESQARAERAGAKPFTAKPEGERGRMLGTNELHGARQLVKAKVHTSEYREEDSFGAPWDHEEEDLGEDEVDSLAHAAGREGGASAAAQPAIPGGSKPGFHRGEGRRFRPTNNAPNSAAVRLLSPSRARAAPSGATRPQRSPSTPAVPSGP